MISSYLKVNFNSDIHLDFEFVKLIGHGKYGNVNLAKRRDLLVNKQYAVKSILRPMIEDKMHIIHRELQILLSVDHPNIVKFYHAYQDPKFIHIVTEYCPGGDLLSKLCEVTRFSEKETASIIIRLLSAVNHLHSMDICHRDIKLDNIMLNSEGSLSDIKLIDFDFAKKINRDQPDLNTIVGTLHYIAPEVFERLCGTSSDIWSVGIVMYVLLVGKPPYRIDNESEVLFQIKNKQLNFNDPEYVNLSLEARDLLSKLLDVDYNSRITADIALKHRWVLGLRSPILVENKRVLNRLKTFQFKGRFKKEIMKIIVKLINAEEIEHSKAVFETLDTDHNGFIKFEELKEGLKSIGVTDNAEIQRKL